MSLNDFGAPGALLIGTGDGNSLKFVAGGKEYFELTRAGVLQLVSGSGGTITAPVTASALVATTGTITTLTVDTLKFGVSSVSSTLVLDAANVLALKNAAVAQTFRVYGSASAYLGFTTNGVNVDIRAVGTNSTLAFYAAGGSGGIFFGGAVANQIFLDANGKFLVVVPAGAIGYGTGAGGTVAQITSKATGVTLDTPCGTITMNNAALNAGIEVSFVVTNSRVAATDVIIVNHSSAGTAGAYLVGISAVGAGSFTITVSNATAGNLSEAIVLSFAVIKSVAA